MDLREYLPRCSGGEGVQDGCLESLEGGWVLISMDFRVHSDARTHYMGSDWCLRYVRVHGGWGGAWV